MGGFDERMEKGDTLNNQPHPNIEQGDDLDWAYLSSSNRWY
jgi:hypothetical protein